MWKILSIKEMEAFLLQDSSVEDIKTLDREHPVKADFTQIMTADEVRHEISVLARIIIRGYVGWPVHNTIVKRRVLVYLTKLYKSAHDMRVGQFADAICKIPSYIPDNHLTIAGGRIPPTRRILDVGKNVAGDKTFYTNLREDGVAVTAFPKMYGYETDKEQQDDFIKNYLNKSSALIVDLRGNGGGNSRYSDELAKQLCGTYVDSAKQTFVRTTPEAKRIQQGYKVSAEWANLPESEDMVLWRTGTNYTIDKETAYMKPIYILTDWRTGSSSEMFLLRMLHHPMVTVVGDNSRGMEVYGYMAQTYLPISKLIIRTGMHYRILEYDNFELHGYTPHIKCKNGVDAFDIALKKIKNKTRGHEHGI